MDDLRAAVGIGPHRVSAIAREHRRQTAEHLVAGDTESTFDAFGLAGRQQARNVVATFGMAGIEHLPRHRLLQNPFEGLVALPPEVRDQADPIDMHIDAERRGRRVIGQPALLAAALGERKTTAAELGRHVHGQVARSLQVSEILGKESVFAVINRAPLGKPGEQVVRQHVILGQHVYLLDGRPLPACDNPASGRAIGKSTGRWRRTRPWIVPGLNRPMETAPIRRAPRDEDEASSGSRLLITHDHFGKLLHTPSEPSW